MTTETHIVHRVLIQARELILKGWTTDVLARDDQGRDCDPGGEVACCWCAIGAILRAVGMVTGQTQRSSERYRSVKGAVTTHMNQFMPKHKGFDYVNDRLGKDAVLALFDRGISTEVSARV